MALVASPMTPAFEISEVIHEEVTGALSGRISPGSLLRAGNSRAAAFIRTRCGAAASINAISNRPACEWLVCPRTSSEQGLSQHGGTQDLFKIEGPAKPQSAVPNTGSTTNSRALCSSFAESCLVLDDQSRSSGKADSLEQFFFNVEDTGKTERAEA